MIYLLKFLLNNRLFSSLIIRCRSIGVIIFQLLLNIFLNHLKRFSQYVKSVGRYIQLFLGIVSGNHYSLVNISDDDFRIETTADQLFLDHNLDMANPHIGDVFHVYLSKLLYETPDLIISQCINWGFRKNSMQIFSYIQSEDMKKYPYSTQAALIKHEESKSIVIAFRGTEPMDLFQWMTDASTNFIPIENIFDDQNIRVHAGFYSALGLSSFKPSEQISFDGINLQSSMFIQLLNSIDQINGNNKEKYRLTITGHSLGAGLASLFTYVLLSYGYQSSISGLYTYGQPLVGNRSYAQLLNDQLGNRIHRWVNHSDIITRIPVVELPSIAWYYSRTPYSDALEVSANQRQGKTNPFYKHYYHSGLRFKINSFVSRDQNEEIDHGPILAYQDPIRLFQWKYSLRKCFDSLIHITPLRALFWLSIPGEINDHFPGDYARNIKLIVKNNSN